MLVAVFYFGTRFVNRIGCRDPTPSCRPTAVRTNAHFPSNRLRRVLQYHDTRVATTRALRGATPDTTTPAFPLREPVFEEPANANRLDELQAFCFSMRRVNGDGGRDPRQRPSRACYHMC